MNPINSYTARRGKCFGRTPAIALAAVVALACFCAAADARALLRDRAPPAAKAIPSGRPLAGGVSAADARQRGHQQHGWAHPAPRRLRETAYGYQSQIAGIAPLGAPYMSNLFYQGSGSAGGIYAAVSGHARAADPLSPYAEAERRYEPSSSSTNEWGLAPQFGRRR